MQARSKFYPCALEFSYGHIQNSVWTSLQKHTDRNENMSIQKFKHVHTKIY
jgi:hypothetical protein